MKHKRPLAYYFLPLAFVLLLFLPHINKVANIWKFERVSENRNFADNLKIDIRHLDHFPDDFRNYYNDNFSFRTPLLDAYHYLKFNYFKVSPHPEKTIIGKNNYYFKAGKEQEIYQGKLNFSSEDLEDLKSEWLSRKHYLDSLNIKFYWMIAPMKHYVYPEHLPFYVFSAPKRRVELLKDYFQPFMPDLIIDPVSELLKNKNKYKLFYQLDNHWTHPASYIASNVLIQHIKKDFPDRFNRSELDVTWRDTSIQKGFHYFVLGIKELKETEALPHFTAQAKQVKGYGFPPIQGFAYPWEYEFTYRNEALDKGLKILIIRDSFFGHIIPFFAEYFKESVFIFDAWRYKLNEEIIKEVKPDVIVFECLEVHIENIINNYRKRKNKRL